MSGYDGVTVFHNDLHVQNTSAKLPPMKSYFQSLFSSQHSQLQCHSVNRLSHASCGKIIKNCLHLKGDFSIMTRFTLLTIFVLFCLSVGTGSASCKFNEKKLTKQMKRFNKKCLNRGNLSLIYGSRVKF